MEDKRNPIEKAIEEGESELDFYLGEVTKEEFVTHVKELKKKYANKGAIEEAINQLKKLL